LLNTNESIAESITKNFGTKQGLGPIYFSPFCQNFYYFTLSFGKMDLNSIGKKEQNLSC
jgi:hypothetical protein